MAFDNAFNCGMMDCITPCIITFVITSIIMLFVHIALYFRFVKIAKEKYPTETWSSRGA
jgi:hypothetical protein